MKVIRVLIIVGMLQLSVSVYSQSRIITCELIDVSVKEVLNEIEKSTDYRFFYNEKFMDLNRLVTVSAQGERVENILDLILAESNVTYKILENNLVVITPKELVKYMNITGIITDANTGEPIAGAMIQVKGTTTGSVSNADGTYSIRVPAESDSLIYSFIGFSRAEIQIGARTVINVVMQKESTTLEEVVIVGYGVIDRRNFTGSITTVNMEDLPSSLSSTTNVMDVLRGITTGISLTPMGEAGAEPYILVRGQRSLQTDANSPLFVLDGVIFNGQMNDLDPVTIENISVLKDASTLAAYGSKAANGVVIITTKRGKPGKPVIDFNSYVTLSEPGYQPSIRDGKGYATLMNYRSGLGPGDYPIWMYPLERSNYESDETTDWSDYISRTGILKNYSVNFSGATDRSNFYLSGGHLAERGIYYGDDYSRNTFSANLSTIINEYIEIGANSTNAFNAYSGVPPDYGAAVTLSPWAEPLLENGDMRKFVDGHEDQTLNPLWDTFNGVEREENHKANILGGFLNIKIPFVEGLTFRTAGSYTLRSTELKSFTHETNFPDMSLGDDGYTAEVFDQYLIDANGSLTTTNNTSWVLDNILTYDRQIGSHYLNASLVYTRNSTESEFKSNTGSDFRAIGNTLLGIYGLSNAGVQKTESFTYSLHNDVGYLARLIYSWQNTYHLNISARYDGSSVFGSKNKWGFFPAIGGAWTISNEQFMQTVNSINLLKLKVSWGRNGNQSLSPYSTLSTISMGPEGDNVYYFGDRVVYGQTITSLGNAGLGWESTASLNYGFEISLLNRFQMNVDAYKSSTTNQIFHRNFPVMGSGITTQFATMGQVDNWGIEIDMNSTNVNRGKFMWTTGLFFSLNRNKLIELYGDGQDDITSSLFLDRSLGAVYGYRWEGIVQEGEEHYLSNIEATPGDAKYADLNHDGQLTAEDREILGYTKENFRMSITNTFTYRNFELYVMLYGVFSGNGYGLYQNNSAYLTADRYFYHNTLDHPYWTPASPNAEYPRWDYIDDRFMALQPYGFVRLQDVSLSYAFNSNLIGRFRLNSLRFYIAGSNLFFYSPHWEGSDPEIRAFDMAQLPRSIKFGLSFQF